MKKALIALSVSLASLAFSASTLANEGLHFNDPYARATAPNAVNSAVFMEIENHSDTDDALVSASSDAAKKVEVHTVEKDGDLIKMRQIDRIDIPSKGKVVLQPGSYHIMLLGINQPLKEGETIDVTLGFADGSTQKLNIPVKNVINGMNQSHSADDKHSSH
ncbi:MAG: copper chaperone PCu(A)C [Vibrio sp.]